ncbi:hypothetical protein [Mycolicibacterium sp. XJ870]
MKGTLVRNLVRSATLVGFLVAALISGGAAYAAPTGPQTVTQVVNQLRARGYQVILNKVGSAPLENCSVSAVRPGHTYSHTDSGAPGAGNDLVTTVTSMTVFVDVEC